MEYMYHLNMNQERRDEIVGNSFISEYGCGLRLIKNLSVSQLQELISENFIALEDGAETGPTHKQLIEFAQQVQESENLSILFNGHAISKVRCDYGIVLDTILIQGEISLLLKEKFLEFVETSSESAGELKTEKDLLYAWFD